MVGSQGVSCIDQFDQTRRIDMCVDLGSGDIRMAQQGLEHPEVGPAGKQMGRKRVAQDVRTDPIRRNTGQSGHAAYKLKKPHPAQMRLPAREEPGTGSIDMRQPFLHGFSGPGRNRDA